VLTNAGEATSLPFRGSRTRVLRGAPAPHIGTRSLIIIGMSLPCRMMILLLFQTVSSLTPSENDNSFQCAISPLKSGEIQQMKKKVPYANVPSPSQKSKRNIQKRLTIIQSYEEEVAWCFNEMNHYDRTNNAPKMADYIRMGIARVEHLKKLRNEQKEKMKQ